MAAFDISRKDFNSLVAEAAALTLSASEEVEILNWLQTNPTKVAVGTFYGPDCNCPAVQADIDVTGNKAFDFAIVFDTAVRVFQRQAGYSPMEILSNNSLAITD